VFTYSVFGIRLLSDFAIPELRESATEGDPSWRLETRSGATPTPALAELIGSEAIDGVVSVKAFRSGEVLRLTFDDTGTFDVLANDRTIVWYPGAGATDAAVRADLLGRVLALAAHAEGRLALHASAVSIQGRAVAFLGPRHAGKSTLALALVQRGARLIADDSLVVRLDGVGAARAAVGVQRPRLWSDALRALAMGGSGGGDKPILDPLPADQLECEEVPLAACYVLTPTSDGPAAIVRGSRLTSVHAALTLVTFTKLGALLGGVEAPVVLDRAAEIAACVPIHSVDVVRDFSRLGHVAAQLFAWHATDSVPNAASPV